MIHMIFLKVLSLSERLNRFVTFFCVQDTNCLSAICDFLPLLLSAVCVIHDRNRMHHHSAGNQSSLIRNELESGHVQFAVSHDSC